MFHIYNDGSGTFPTIQAALDSVPADNRNPVLLYIHAGVYRERLTITSPYITLAGDGPGKTVIVQSYSAREILADGSKPVSYTHLHLRAKKCPPRALSLTADTSCSLAPNTTAPWAAHC